MENVFRKAKRILQGVADAEKMVKRVENRRCDWEDAQDVAAYRSEKRREGRKAALDRVCKSRICPRCGCGPLKDSQLVLNKSRTAVLCRSCYAVRDQEGVKVSKKIFVSVEKRYVVDGSALIAARESLGISCRRFAKLGGWSRNWQYKVESGDTKLVTEDMAKQIIQVIEEAGGTVDDVIT